MFSRSTDLKCRHTTTKLKSGNIWHFMIAGWRMRVCLCSLLLSTWLFRRIITHTHHIFPFRYASYNWFRWCRKSLSDTYISFMFPTPGVGVTFVKFDLGGLRFIARVLIGLFHTHTHASATADALGWYIVSWWWAPLHAKRRCAFPPGVLWSTGAHLLTDIYLFGQ